MANYLIKEETMQGIADGVKGLYFENNLLTTNQIQEKITNTRLGIPIKINNHLVNGKWIRPNEYPNLDNISLENFEGVYLTYDLRKFAEKPYIAIRVNLDNSGIEWHVQRGHLVNNEFVVDENYTLQKTTTEYRNDLSSINGNVQLWRVYSESKISQLHFITNTNDSTTSILGGLQPVVERRGRLPNINRFSTSVNLVNTGILYTYASTFFLEKDYLILPSTIDIYTRYCYRESYSLQELTWLGENNGIITINSTNSNTVDAASGMFVSCYSLPVINLNNVRFGEYVINLIGLFQECRSLISIDLSNSLRQDVAYMLGNLFQNCISLKNIKFGKNIIASTFAYVFTNCYSLENVDLQRIDVSGVPSFYGLFEGCMSIKEINLSSWNMPNNVCTDTRSIFNALFSIETITLPLHWGIDSTSTNAIGIPINSPCLKNFNGLEIYQNCNFSSLYLLTHDSLVNILNRLPIITSSKTITLGEKKKQLTSEELAIATEKGWTVA